MTSVPFIGIVIAAVIVILYNTIKILKEYEQKGFDKDKLKKILDF